MVDPIATGWTVERAAKIQFEAVARNAGVSAAYFFEQMVARMELTEQGVPDWWTSPSRDKESPIDTA